MSYERMNLQDGVDKWCASHVEHIEDELVRLYNKAFGKTMTVVIDLSNSDPLTCCSYEDDASEMSAGASAWDEFFGHYPVLMKDGVEVVKLNPNNYAEDINGNPVDIESGSAGDVMIAFPRKGLRITGNETDMKIRISFTNIEDPDNFEYYAHTFNNNSLNTFYTGAYNGYIDENNKLRSLSGKTPACNITIGEARAAAHNNGDTYEQFAWFQLIYLQAMFIMKYKSINGQSSLGCGNVNGEEAIASGIMNTCGLDWGIPYDGDNTDMTQGMKFAGIENFWGNIWNWVDGIVSDDNCNYKITTNNFNDYGEGYEITAEVDTEQVAENGYLEDYLIYPCATSEGGFALKKMIGAGSETTYFSDVSDVDPGGVAYFGGCWGNGLLAGPFFFYVVVTPDDAGSGVGARVQKL